MHTLRHGPDKYHALSRLRETLDTATDKAGQPIEEGIKEVVLYLNALGVQTSFSCEGHFDGNGLPAPWVSFVPEDGSDDGKRVRQKLGRYVEAFNSGRDRTSDASLEVVEEYGGYRLSNRGYSAIREKFLNGSVVEGELKEIVLTYRAEMALFALFLKKRWERS